MGINADKLEELVNKTQYMEDPDLNASFRKLIIKTINELDRYTERTLKQLEFQVLKNNSFEKKYPIFTALIDDEQQKEYPFNNMHEIKIFPEDAKKVKNSNPGKIFLDAEYSEICRILGDNLATPKICTGCYRKGNEKQEFKYHLKFDDSFLEMQDTLCRLSEIYEVDNAILYSPYIHKAVKVVFDEQIPEKPEEISYQFNKNGIPVKENKFLLWNFRACETKIRKADARKPYGDTERYIYYFSSKDQKSNRRIYAVPGNNQTLVFDAGFNMDEDGKETTFIVIDREMESFILFEYFDIDSETVAKNKSLYCNMVERTDLLPSRIISEGDIELAIAPFRNISGRKCETAESELTEKCRRYSAKYRGSSSSFSAGFKKIKTVYLKFSSKEKEKFFDDYINYVLEYLDHYYPETEWVGGY